jgi:AcrR family transcriptional regulator
MPKIIENLESRLISEAKKQIAKAGYGAMTIRSVAKGCGVGVGTVYNYFESKDALIAAFMLEDWKTCTMAINAVSAYSDKPENVVRCIYDQLCQFVQRHQPVIRDNGAAAAFAGSFSRYHGLLRKQLAQPLRKFCGSDFASEFIAEAVLAWTVAGRSFDEIYGMIDKLF